MTSQEMMRRILPPGKWFWNVAPLGVPDWQIGEEAYLDPEFREGKRTLFGYDERTFLLKQYRDKP